VLLENSSYREKWPDVLVKMYLERGELYFMIKDYAAALSDSNEALRIDPELADAILVRGAAMVGLGKVEEGRREMARAIRLKPELKHRMANAAR
jgi:Tfp pilus assembly protein PilF